MMKILITGANSYIGSSFENYMKNWADKYAIDTLDMIDGTWKEKNFSSYDVVFHVAGIAHKKETKKNAHLYYKVNRNLAIETAQKARADGVKQFIFLSSMSIYGLDEGVITKDTVPMPKSNYGKSKLQAEDGIKALSSEKFRVCMLRPPMVYGRGCKGNFQKVCKLVKKSPIFPRINNKRSMIYIDNLSSFVKMCIDKNLEGIYFPQNREYMNTSEMARIISEEIQKQIWISKLAGLIIGAIRPLTSIVQKAFGNLVYENTEDFGYSYCVVEKNESVRLSVE
ncbi:MAG: NAD-dependent epimerase/dehydratase family protein [Lachnospiraceae bacterium]|nr:NAD-dependent epimerase/dehydratase family protein [Lachnospiraceae bacterium]